MDNPSIEGAVIPGDPFDKSRDLDRLSRGDQLRFTEWLNCYSGMTKSLLRKSL